MRVLEIICACKGMPNVGTDHLFTLRLETPWIKPTALLILSIATSSTILAALVKIEFESSRSAAREAGEKSQFCLEAPSSTVDKRNASEGGQCLGDRGKVKLGDVASSHRGVQWQDDEAQADAIVADVVRVVHSHHTTCCTAA